MADEMIDGKPVEDVMAVRLASEALRHLAADEERFATFQAELLAAGGDMPLGASREVAEQPPPDLLAGAQQTFVAVMIREGYQ
jgi:hypothetical protein